MKSTRDYLSQASQARLQDLIDVVRISVAGDLAAKNRAEELIDALVVFLQQEKITIEYDETHKPNQKLLDLLTQAARAQYELDAFNAELVVWAASYRKYDARKKSELAIMSLSAIADNEGVIRALLQDKDPSSQEADETDANFILRQFTKQRADQIVAGKYNVLATIDITSAGQLLSVIQSYIQSNERKEFSLIAPVCCARTHWCVLELKVKHGHITMPQLWDPKGSDVDALKSTSAYQNSQELVSTINKGHKKLEKLVVKAVKADVQPDSDYHRCMDFGAQYILQKVDATHPIALARTPIELREAVVEDISINHADVKKHLADKVKAKGKAKEKVKEKTSAALTLPRYVEKQIEFDALMAKNLQAIYDAPENFAVPIAKESSLVKRAKQQTKAELPKVATLLKKYGILAKPAAAPCTVISTVPKASTSIVVK